MEVNDVYTVTTWYLIYMDILYKTVCMVHILMFYISFIGRYLLQV